MSGKTDRQTDRQTDRHTYTLTDGQKAIGQTRSGEVHSVSFSRCRTNRLRVDGTDSRIRKSFIRWRD